jgi:DNA-directed RNA polymerase subunit E'
MQDFISYNPELPGFVGKESKHSLIVEDKVLIRVTNISFKQTIADTKIGLTMRQSGLGKPEWKNEVKSVSKSKSKKESKEKKEKKAKKVKTTKGGKK